MIKTIIKRSGTESDFDPEKLNKWGEWSSKDCGVNWSSVVFDAIKSLHDKCTTKDLQQSLINACIAKKTDGYTHMAANLLVGDIYKEVFGGVDAPSLKEFYKNMVTGGFWRDMGYSDSDLDYLNSKIDHSKDFTYSYATLKQFSDKYGISINDKLIETPQMCFMGIAMSNMQNDTLDDVVSAYQAVSSLKNNLPTPTVSLERTPQLPAPSCCVISGGDSVESIGAANHVAYTMTAKSAGIGIELRTRAPKDPVKGGKISHAGKHGYYSLIDKSVKANKQIVRGGSATVTFHALDPEIEELLTMKQIRTDQTYRIDTMDFSFAVNNLFLRKVAKNEQWMTISPYYANDLWDASYCGDEAKFESLYEMYLGHPKAVMKNARDIFVAWCVARGDSGRVYLTLLDNVNKHTPFKDKIMLSNLCQEVLLPTSPYKGMEDLFDKEGQGETALCNLAAIVVSRIKDDEEYESIAYTTCKIVDNTIEGGVYPFARIERSAKARRSVGIGITDLATLMAEEGLLFSSREGRTRMHEIAERHSYFLHKASVRLAKERGKCDWFHKTKYSDGWLPIDSYSKSVDEHHDTSLKYDWESLREEIKERGMRFSVLEAFMPAESSSVLTNTTNGIYPVRANSITKNSQKGNVYFRVKDGDTLHYEKGADINHLDMVKFYAIFQKFCGQSISADFTTKLDGNEAKISVKDLLQRVILCSKLGVKTMYYEIFKTGSEEKKVEDQGDCESCKL